MYAPHQYFPPRHQLHPQQLHYPGYGYRPMAPYQACLSIYLSIIIYLSIYLQGPPSYRPPPPVSIHPGAGRELEEENINETVLSAATLSGSPMPPYPGYPDTMQVGISKISIHISNYLPVSGVAGSLLHGPVPRPALPPPLPPHRPRPRPAGLQSPAAAALRAHEGLSPQQVTCKALIFARFYSVRKRPY